MRRLDCLIAVEPSHLLESVDQIFLVTDFEIFAFAFAGEIEPIYCLCLCVHESSRVLFSETCASYSDYMVGDLVGDRIEMSVGKIDCVLADYIFYSKFVAIYLVLHRHSAENQEDNSDCYQNC